MADTFVSTIITNWKTSWPCPSLLLLVSGDGYHFIFTIFRYAHLCSKDARLSKYPLEVRKNRIPPRPLTCQYGVPLTEEIKRKPHLLPIFHEEPSSSFIVDPKPKKKKAGLVSSFHIFRCNDLRNNETFFNEDVSLLTVALIILPCLLIVIQPLDQNRREVNLCLQTLQPTVAVTCIVVFEISK